MNKRTPWDVVSWVCQLYDPHIHSEYTSSVKTIRIIKVLFAKKGYVGNSMSEAEIKLWLPTLQIWPEIHWKRFAFCNAFTNQNTRKCWTRADCNQRKFDDWQSENQKKTWSLLSLQPFWISHLPFLRVLCRGSFWQIIALLSTLSTLLLSAIFGFSKS